MKYITTIDGVDYEVELLEDGKVSVNGETYDVDFEEASGQVVFTLLINNRSFEAHVSEEDDEFHVMIQGTLYTAEVVDEREKRLREAGGESDSSSGEFILQAPMPGLVVEVGVKEGDEVEQGDVLVILESMKMQNELKAPRPGKISAVHISKGDSVEKRDEMLVLAPEGD